MTTALAILAGAIAMALYVRGLVWLFTSDLIDRYARHLNNRPAKGLVAPSGAPMTSTPTNCCWATTPGFGPAGYPPRLFALGQGGTWTDLNGHNFGEDRLEIVGYVP